jgi:predicted TIM-barrel fold metal-dependent hydrolase
MHLWDVDAHHYPWLVGHELGTSYLLNDYLNESSRYHFNKAVHIQAGIDRPDSVLETAWLDKVSREANFPLSIVGYVDLSMPDCERVIEQHLAFPHFSGIRQILCDDIDYLSIDEWRKNIALMNKYQLVFDAQIRPEQADQLCEVIARSETPFVLEHLGLPRDLDADYYIYWQNQMKKLSEFDHVFMKLSGADNAQSYFLGAIDLFGVDRCMFGSNFPVDKHHKTLDQMYDGYNELCSQLSLTEDEKYSLFYLNAEKIYF